MTTLVIFGILVVILLIWWIALHNVLVRARNACQESWADVDAELQRRYDLIPRLVEVVRAHAQHERQVLESVTQARTRALASRGPVDQQARDEQALVGDLRSLLSLSEAYPALTADRSFLRLQEELVTTEDRLQAARRFYNANVRDFTNRCELLPSSLVAGFGGFQPPGYFQIDRVTAEAPRIGGNLPR